MELGAATGARTGSRERGPGPGVLQPHARPLPSSPRRLRRVALVAALVALIPALGSYLHTMSQPSNSSLGIRSVEWLRDNGAAGLVSRVESIYYSLTAPSKGGPALRALPTVGYGSAGASRARRATASSNGASALAGAPAYRPPHVAPLIHPALPGEGS